MVDGAAREYLAAVAAARGADERGRREARRAADRIRLQGYRRACQSWITARLTPATRARAERVWFWFNHFNVFWRKGVVGAALPDYLDTAIAPHVDGRFVVLLRAAVTHPAMLVYLDGVNNRAGGLNENLARELLELHTLGVHGGYAQADVQEVARVLTGLRLSPLERRNWPARLQAQVRDDGRTLFDPRLHDDGVKHVLGRRIAGEGIEQVDALLALLARQPATARHVAQRLCLHQWGTAVDAAAVDCTAAAFMASDGDLAAVHAACTGVPAAPADRFKDPMRWTFSALDWLLQGQVPRSVERVPRWLAYLGQPLFACPTPDGYSLDGRDWLDAGALLRRFEVAREMVRFLPEMAPEAAADRGLEALLAAARDTATPALRGAMAAAASREHAAALVLSSPDFMHW